MYILYEVDCSNLGFLMKCVLPNILGNKRIVLLVSQICHQYSVLTGQWGLCSAKGRGYRGNRQSREERQRRGIRGLKRERGQRKQKAVSRGQ